MTDRKTRTREHQIADLNYHCVAYYVIKAGFTIDVPSDYGYDGFIVCFSDKGHVENGTIYIQLKATDHIKIIEGGKKISFSLEKADIDLWAGEPFPVYLIVFDAKKEISYWLYLQKYFQENHIDPFSMTTQKKAVHIDAASILTEASLKEWKGHKDAVLAQMTAIFHG